MLARVRRRGFLALCAASALACDRGQEQPAEQGQPVETAGQRATVDFGRATVVLHSATDSVVVPVEVAEREDQRAFGLMDRESLPIDAGMVFLYPALQDPNAGFWMYRTRIPLDIAFFDASGRIVAIRQMAPCTSPDPARCTQEASDYRPGVPYLGALEVNSGFFRTHGIEVGDHVVVRR